MDKVHFYKSEEFFPLASRLFEKQKESIIELIPKADVQHVGSTAIPGSLTIGDLDIQVRVKQEDFQLGVDKLSTIYHKNHPDLWNDGFALFHKKDHEEIPMSIILTVINSPYDEFSKIRDRLLNDPNLLKLYNQLKQDNEGKTLQEYRKAKGKFFGPNGNSRLL